MIWVTQIMAFANCVTIGYSHFITTDVQSNWHFCSKREANAAPVLLRSSHSHPQLNNILIKKSLRESQHEYNPWQISRNFSFSWNQAPFKYLVFFKRYYIFVYFMPAIQDFMFYKYTLVQMTFIKGKYLKNNKINQLNLGWLNSERLLLKRNILNHCEKPEGCTY